MGNLSGISMKKTCTGTGHLSPVGATQVTSSPKAVGALRSPRQDTDWCSLHVPVVRMVLQVLASASFCPFGG